MNIQFNTAPPAAIGTQEPVLPHPRTAPEPSAPAAQAPTAPPNTETIKQVARKINDALKASAANIEFMVDDESKQVVVRVVDSQTRQLIRQMPSEEMLALSKSMDQMIGLLIQQKAG